MTFYVRDDQVQKENLFGHHILISVICFKNKLKKCNLLPIKKKYIKTVPMVIPLLGFLYRNSPLIT